MNYNAGSCKLAWDESVSYQVVGNGSATPYADGATYPFSTDATLYAQWTPVAVSFVPVGSFVSTDGTGLTTASDNLVHAGDVLVIWVKSRGTPIRLTAIVGSGSGAVGTAVRAFQYFTVQHANSGDEIWFVPVTKAGTITLTFSWSSSNASSVCEYSTQEFQPSAAAT